MTTNLFGDELPKHIKEIGKVNKIARKTMSHANVVPSRALTIKVVIPAMALQAVANTAILLMVTLEFVWDDSECSKFLLRNNIKTAFTFTVSS